MITKIVINIAAFLTSLVAFIGVSYGEVTLPIIILIDVSYPSLRQKRDDDAVHHLRVSLHRSLDSAGGADSAGDGSLPDHQCGHHHHGR